MTDAIFDRASGIGGSDVAAILGVSPWEDRTAVWLEKTRHPSYRPKAQTEEMRWGTLLEPVMRLAYSQDSGRKVHAPGDHTYWAPGRIRYAHLDGLVEGEGIWEGKFPINTWRNWKDGPPVYVQAQIQHYMDITREPWCDVSALLPGADFATWRIDADPETQAHIRDVVERFWNENVLTGIPPDPLPAIIEYPRHVADLRVVADEEAERLVRLLREVRESAITDARDEEGLKEQLKRLIGTAAGMDGDGWHIRYKKSKDSKQVEWKLVAAAYRAMIDDAKSKLLDINDQEEAAAEALRVLTDTPADVLLSLYTTTKDGPRPFVLEFDE